MSDVVFVHYALKDSVVEKQVNYNCVESDYKRNSKHKFYVLGLVANCKHAKVHCNATADSREEHKRFFGYAKLNLVLFRNLFVVDADDD